MTIKIKNITKFSTLAVLTLLLSLSGCLSELEDTPPDTVDIDRILGSQNIQDMITSAYSGLDNDFSGYNGGSLLEAYTDDAFLGGAGHTPEDWHAGILAPEVSLFANARWVNYWQGIRRANLAIQYLPQSTVPPGLVTPAQLEEWVDEGKVLRAWYHFELLRTFGPVPYIEEAIDLGAAEWSSYTRPPVEVLTDRIVGDLDDVITNDVLPLRKPNLAELGRVNLGVAYLLKARVLLYAASPLYNPMNDLTKWQAAATAAHEARTALEGEYSLVDIAEYGTMFDQDANTLNPEVILRSTANSAGFMNNQNGIDLTPYGSTTQNANCGAVPTQELVDAFELTDGTLPIVAYDVNHTSPTFAAGYSENAGDDIYAGRDARFAHSVVYNGANFGRYKGLGAGDPDVVVYTFLNQAGTGFNNNPTSTQDNDLRRSSTGYYGGKYRSADYWGSTTGGTNSNKIFFRLAELYLIQAEALMETGDIAGAAAALNVVRARAGQPNIENVPGYLATQDFLRERIRNDRRVELCFENHRFYDQRRWDELETNIVITRMRITSDDETPTGVFSYERIGFDLPRNSLSDKYLQLPIPQEEARRLPGLGQPAAYN